MRSIQGEFGSREVAKRAAATLAEAGVDRSSIRVWNIIPEAHHASHRRSAVGKGALFGGLLGGIWGALFGAYVGTVADASSYDDEHMPEPTGARVVVDLHDGGPDVRGLLMHLGASHVH